MTARTYARIPVGIGAEFRRDDLTPNARLLFFVLTSQQKVAPCGLLELQESRWARDSGLSTIELDNALEELDAAGWVHIDIDTAELVIPRHLRDDIQVTNRKIVKGVYSSIDRIESDRLRQVVLDRIAEIPDFPPPPGGGHRPNDRASDRPIHGPNDRPVDSPSSLSPEPVTNSSSSAVTPTGPVDNPDDDDLPPAAHLDPDDPVQRAELACHLIGDHDFDRARRAGRITVSPTRYRARCRVEALDAWRSAALELAELWPTWPPTEIAEYLEHGYAPADPSTAHAPPAPDIDLRDAPVTELENGALVVDLDAARRKAGTA